MAKKSTKQWFEREEFWNNFGPIMFDAQRWAEAPDVAEAVKKICGLKKGSSILDAGCGPGRISLELAKLDLKVTGVDLIQSELDAAEESAQDEGAAGQILSAKSSLAEIMQRLQTTVRHSISIILPAIFSAEL